MTTRDVFLSHASEDKATFVRPFAEELKKRGISYWLDEAEIKWGDRITKEINLGLSRARFVVVFLSINFLGRNWPEAELGAALSKENTQGQTIVLPLVIGDPKIVLQHYPLLGDKMYLRWTSPPTSIVDHLEHLLGHFQCRQHKQEDESESQPILEELLGSNLMSKVLGDKSEADRFTGALYALFYGHHWSKERFVNDILDKVPSPMTAPIERWLQEYNKRIAQLNHTISREPPSDGSLEITSLTEKCGELDVMLRNLSDHATIISKIIIRIMKDYGAVAPILEPSAAYRLPIGDLCLGDSKDLMVTHLLDAHRADRLLIDLETTRVVLVRLTLEYNKQYSVSENVWLWSNTRTVAVCKAEMEIEITVMRAFDTYTNADQDRLLRAIRLFLEMEEGELKITKKRRGSVKLTLSLPCDKAEQLIRAIKAGKFEEYGAVDAELKESVYALPLTFYGDYYTANLDRRFLEGNNHYYLAIKVDMHPRALEQLLNSVGKVSAREVMPILRQYALPGVEVRYLEAPPRELPLRPGWSYFELEHRSLLWEKIRQYMNMVVYCHPEQLPPESTEIQLLVLEEDKSTSESVC